MKRSGMPDANAEGMIMKHWPVKILIALNFLSAGCASLSGETHARCVRTEKVAQYQQYCCNGYSDTGHCRGYCTRSSGYAKQCVEWDCDAGFVKEEKRKEDVKWWRFDSPFRCVPSQR